MSISNFPPGTTHAICKICNKPVKVTDDSDEWNESPRNPCHRLCANRTTTVWTAPLNCHELELLWVNIRAEAKGSRQPFALEKKAEVIRAIADTVTTSQTRASTAASRLLYLIDHALWDQPLGFKRVAKRPD